MTFQMPRITTSNLPDRQRIVPAAIGLGLVAAGALLWRLKPSILALPDPKPLDEHSKGSRMARAVQTSRDGIAQVAPDNLSVSLGRSLVFAGGTLLVTRLLDELSTKRRG